MSDNPLPKTKLRTFIIVLVIVFVGPIIGLIFAAVGIVFAPAWIFLTSLLYLSVLLLGLLIGIVAVLKKWIGLRGFVLGLVLLRSYALLLGDYWSLIAGRDDRLPSDGCARSPSPLSLCLYLER